MRRKQIEMHKNKTLFIILAVFLLLCGCIVPLFSLAVSLPPESGVRQAALTLFWGAGCLGLPLFAVAGLEWTVWDNWRSRQMARKMAEALELAALNEETNLMSFRPWQPRWRQAVSQGAEFCWVNTTCKSDHKASPYIYRYPTKILKSQINLEQNQEDYRPSTQRWRTALLLFSTSALWFHPMLLCAPGKKRKNLLYISLFNPKFLRHSNPILKVGLFFVILLYFPAICCFSFTAASINFSFP